MLYAKEQALSNGSFPPITGLFHISKKGDCRFAVP
jgi:hypothetical protein